MAFEVNVVTTRVTDKKTGNVKVTVKFEADRVNWQITIIKIEKANREP